MYAPINQIQSANDEDEDQTEESFIRYYNIKNFGQAQDLACLNGSPSNNPSKIRQIQEGFDLASPDMKAKKRKAEAAVDVGGRVIRAAGRKDKHSKVCTNRGPRDRRVRLSPRTAIQFYDVQDRLGYDRPSKAIDWLINEAKTAIDALDERQSISFADPNAAEIHGFSLSKHGMREKHEKFDDESLVSGFGCFLDEAAPPSAAASEVGFDQDSIFMRNKSEICPNLEMFAWNNYGNEIRGGGGGAQYFSGNSPPLLAAAQPLSSYVSLFSQREPLQSSFINYSPINNDFNFSNELSKIAASATAKQDQNSKKMSFSMPSATTHYQD